MNDHFRNAQNCWKEELSELLEASLRDDITDQQLQRLEELVLSEPAARTHAAEYLSVSQAVREWAEASDLIAESAPLASSAVPDDGHASVMEKVEKEIMRRPRISSFAVAAVVMGILVTSLALIAPPVYRAMRHSMATAENAEPEFVAALTSTFEAQWADGQIGTQRGAKMGPGHHVKLTSGFAEIAFYSGASIVVEGPAHLTIGDDRQATLLRGRLVARVPAAAKGFTIATAQGQIVDLGTEFAVDVDPQRDVQVHVIEGSVELRGASGQSPAASQVLSAGNAAKFRRETGKLVVTPIEYQVAGFTRRAPLADVQWTADSPLPVGRSLSLWLSADFGVVRDSQGRVAIWKDRLTGDNHHAENALQIEAARRPALVADGIGGQPSLVFDGRTTNLITSPRNASGEQTIFFVAAPETLKAGTQLLNTGGVPNYVIELASSGEVSVRSFDGKQNLPQLKGSSHASTAPLLIAFRHSQNEGRSKLLVYGEAQSEGVASTANFGSGRLHLGSHISFQGFYAGQLAELIVYDDALSDEELSVVSDYLGKKYNLIH
jgi:hypothetical protein